jgi:penicillin V acylase-like amidase (Ntn superfamily)
MDCQILPCTLFSIWFFPIEKENIMTILYIFPTRFSRSILVAGCAILLLGEALLACTSFCLQDGNDLVFVKNTDIFNDLDDGFIIVNKRTIAKRGIAIDAADTPACWISKYGSVTFNILGRELPDGGINEAGLAIEGLGLSEAKYPGRDSRPVLVSWIQYQLDNNATVKEVIESDHKIRVAAGLPVTFHALVCDRHGDVATFEFLDGKLVCHTGDALTVPALANDTYDKSLAYLKQYQGFGGPKNIPYGSWVSLDRFVCVADRIEKYYGSAGESAIDYAFDTLADVKCGDQTERMTVYDLKKMEIHYKTLRYPEVKTIRLADCDFDSRTPVQVIIANTAHTGVLNGNFHDYEADLNRWLIYYSFRHIDRGNLIPDVALQMLAQYGDEPGMHYLSDWEVAGPYSQKDKDYMELFDIPFGPEQSGSNVKWQPISTKSMGKHPAYLGLNEALKGGEQAVAYLRTQDKSPERMQALLEIYSDDGVKAWLNGQLIHSNNVTRGIASQPDTVKVTLKQGTNHLMLKVTQNNGSWGAVVRLRPVCEPESAN